MQVLDAADFQPAVVPPALAEAEIHLWFFPHWDKVREAVQAPAVRALLATYLGAGVEALHFDRGEHGKPHLAGLQFNLSHTGTALLLGVSRSIALGVDLEQTARRVRPIAELSRRWFAPSEAQVLGALPESAQQPAFLGLWTCKEAVLKCSGSGIGAGLGRVEFELTGDGGVCGLRSDEPWQVIELRPDPAHIGALAFRGKPARVRAFVTQAIAAGPQSS